MSSSDGDPISGAPMAEQHASELAISSSWMLDNDLAPALNDRGSSQSPSDTDSDSSAVRENRFPGSASTWRHHASEEIALDAALEKEEGQDLAIHLFNTHALKSRLYDADLARQSKAWQGKKHWMERDASGKLPWYPRQHWSAWPLPPQKVPRPAEEYEWAEKRNFQSLTSSTEDLEGEVQAAMLRYAKGRFRSRMAITLERDANAISRSHNRVFEGDSLQRSASVDIMREVQNPEHESGQRSPSVEIIDDDALQRSPSVIEVQHVGSPPVSSSVHDVDRPSGRRSLSIVTVIGRKKQDSVTDQDPPELTADEEVEARLLRPAVRHILSKLDNLLMALHRSRVANIRSAREPAHSLGQTRSQKRKRRETSEVDPTFDRSAEDTPSLDDPQPPNSKTATPRRPSGKHTPRPRDWSEVLGLAALSGWDPRVVERSSARCVSLFGEQVTFRVMPETSVGAPRDREVMYRPDLVPESDAEPDASADSQSEECEDGELVCPVSSCPRYKAPFELRWRLHEHLRRKHGFTRDEIENIELPGRTTPGRDVKASISMASSRAEPIGEEGMLGAVHIDGFGLPVTTRLIRGKDRVPRKRKASLARITPQ